MPPCLFTGNYNIGENLFAAIRQDTSLRRVYIYDFSSSSEMLLYDFSLSAGATLPPAYNNPYYPNVQVTRIDSILLTDGYHKRFVLNVPLLSVTDSISIIEGVGSSVGLLAALATPFENHDILLCYSDNTQTIYPDATTNCTIALGVPAIDRQAGFGLYPNPFTDRLEVNLPEGMTAATIHMYQADGRLVLSRDISSREYKLSLPELNRGIYLLHIETTDGIFVQKLVKL